MSDDILIETLLHGNLEMVYNSRDIKKISPLHFHDIIKDFSLSHNGIYRFYINYKNYLSIKEIDLIKENKPESILLFDILNIIIEKADSLEVFHNLDIRINTADYNSMVKIFIYNLIHLLHSKIKYYLLENNNLLDYYNKFKEKFSRFSAYFNLEDLVINYIIPLDDSSWRPSWKIIYNNEDHLLEGIDTFIDTVFRYSNIQCYSHIMYLEIRYINERLEYLKNHSSKYYPHFIKANVEKLTKNVFENFPLQLVYRDYYDTMLKHKDVYRPEITKYIRVENFTKDIYILTILPLYLTAYLLGYPILRSDIPAIKNMHLKIKHFKSETYYDNLANNFNLEYHKLLSIGVDCANAQDEEGNYLNLFYNRIIDFNIDDTLQVFNNGVYHLFTSPEYSELSKKGTNFYNRSELKVIDPIIYNLRFKRKTKRFLANRGISVELNSTLKDNFLEIKKALKNQEIISERIPDRGLHFSNESLINLLLI